MTAYATSNTLLYTHSPLIHVHAGRTQSKAVGCFAPQLAALISKGEN